MNGDLLLKSLHTLRQYLKLHDKALEDAVHKAQSLNPWFIPEFTRHAIESIADQYLDEEKFVSWRDAYPVHSGPPKKIGIVMAGNVPLVGFHDLISVLASGHHAQIKLSEKDSVLSRFITDEWIKIEPALATRISYTEKLEQYDAVIATGSNNSARYFEYYFRNHPHILRRNRNGVAVLTGKEKASDLKELSKDIFLYFGLGCRNVSKVYVPEEYDFSGWEEAISEWKYLGEHNKYKNNLDYNLAIYMINRVPHIDLGHLVLKEDNMIASRIGTVYYSYYRSVKHLASELEKRREEIQCLVSVDPVDNWEHIKPGLTQYPSLNQYADGVDTMKFLTSLA